MNHYIETTTLLERLVDWREAIHRHGPEHFDMSSWGYSNEGVFVDDGDQPEVRNDLGLGDVYALDISACGSTACAAGHFVCLSGLTMEQVPVDEHRGQLDIETYLCSVLDVPEALFDRYSWDVIELGETTMMDRCLAYEIEHLGRVTAEWLTVLDYLDARIKAAMAVTE